MLLSMHASCSEVLDLVSYLRPRKVYPNVIPTNSSREEVGYEVLFTILYEWVGRKLYEEA